MSDEALGITTAKKVPQHRLGLEGSESIASYDYEPTSYGVLETLFDALPIEPRDYAFIDLGAGQGRPVFVAEYKGFAHTTGVELSKPLYEQAMENRRRRNSSAQLLHMSAADFVFPPRPSVVFMFNPFGYPVIGQVFDALEKSVKDSAHDVFLLYHNPLYADELADHAPSFAEFDRGEDWILYRAQGPSQEARGSKRVKEEPTLQGGPKRRRVQFHLENRVEAVGEHIAVEEQGAKQVRAYQVKVVAAADEERMSQRPIVQDPSNPDREHPHLPQPHRTRAGRDGRVSYRSSADIPAELLKKILGSANQVFDGGARGAFEREHLEIQSVEGEHRLVARKDISAGSVIPHSAQYVPVERVEKHIDDLSHRLSHELKLNPVDIRKDAEARINAENKAGLRHKGAQYTPITYGAGNASSYIAYDNKSPNMSSIVVPTLDTRQGRQGGPRGRAVLCK